MSSSILIRLQQHPRRLSSLMPTSSSTSWTSSARSALHPAAKRLSPSIRQVSSVSTKARSSRTTVSLLSQSAATLTTTQYHPHCRIARTEQQWRHGDSLSTPNYISTPIICYRAGWNHDRFASVDRRWASSIVVAEESHGYETELEDEGKEEDLIFEEEEEDLLEYFDDKNNIEDEGEPPITSTTTVTDKPKKMTKRQKRKMSLAGEVKFLHFRKANDDEEQAIQKLQGDFDRLALANDLSKFKWISMLENSLVLKLRQEEEQDKEDQQHPSLPTPNQKGRRRRSNKSKHSNNRMRDLWKVALKAAGNKKRVPDDLKKHFLSWLVLGVEESPNDDLGSDGGKLVGSAKDHRSDAQLLARARDLAVEHPLLWRRYSARERKLRVKRSKKLVEKRAERTATGNDVDAATLAAMADNSTALGYYLQHVRISALRQVHFEEKTDDQRKEEALRMQQVLRRKLPEASYRKVLALVQTYVDCFDSDDTEEEPEESSATIKSQKNKKQQQKQFRVLLSNLRKTLPQGRIHWIGRDVATFFYVTQPDEVDTKRIGVHDDDPIDNDPILQYSEADWADVRDQYVGSLRNIQNLFLELERELERQLAQGFEEEAKGGLGTIQSDDPSSERNVLQTFETVAALTRMDAKRTSTQRVKPRTYIPLEAMALGETWKMPLSDHFFEENLLDQGSIEDTPNDESLPDNNTTDESSINFDSNNSNSITGASTAIFGSDVFPIRPPIDRLVVIDNLPIDITESRLRGAYSRCGDIDAISIFHARPDLDPGKRATDSKKKIRNPSSSSRKQKWMRPRTPLYAMILYRDPESARTASCDPLRIFGIVLDQHLMRSHRAENMSTLYLEDVPYNTVSVMESKLNGILGSSDLYVVLDDDPANNLSLHTRIGHGKSKRQQRHQLSSYTIRFPSFEAAYWSYWKLSLGLDCLAPSTASSTETPGSLYRENGPALHWMETPRDAHLYWTRKLNF